MRHRSVPIFLLAGFVDASCGSSKPKAPVEFFIGSRTIPSATLGTTKVDFASSDQGSGSFVLQVEVGKQPVSWNAGGVAHRGEVEVGPKGGSISVNRRPPLLSVEGDVKIVTPAK